MALKLIIYDHTDDYIYIDLQHACVNTEKEENRTLGNGKKKKKKGKGDLVINLYELGFAN